VKPHQIAAVEAKLVKRQEKGKKAHADLQRQIEEGKAALE